MSQDKIPTHSDFKPLPRHTLEGGFNQHFVYLGPAQKPFLKRIPLTAPEREKIIKTNLEQWGFDRDGGTIAVRTPEEMHQFVEKALKAGLRILPVTSDGEGGSLIPYLENAVTLDKYLKAAPDAEAKRTLGQLFEDIIKAHQTGIVYGDRWYNNILVDPEFGITNIDFDLKLEGPGKELDLAQSIFFAIALDKDRSPAIVASLLKNVQIDYDFELVKKFIDTKERRSREKYGDLSGVFRDLFEQLGGDKRIDGLSNIW